MDKQVNKSFLYHSNNVIFEELFIELWIGELKNNIENNQWERDFVLNLLSEKSETIFNYPKVIREILLLFSKGDTNKISQDIKLSVIFSLMKNIQRRQFLTNYLPKYLNDKEFNSKSATLFAELLLKYPKNSNSKDKSLEDDAEFLKQAIESALVLWSEVGFVQNASVKHLKCK